MRRFSKILSGFGAIELLCSAAALYIFDHLPFPWGAGTLAMGLGEGGDDWVDRAMTWEFHVMTGIFGAGLMGALFLLIGGAAYLLSRIQKSRLRLHRSHAFGFCRAVPYHLATPPEKKARPSGDFRN
jgi:hypothetical protein